ncbi:MAG TPA: DMT family transporter [Acidimicrobiales bacterium]|nr:DMT family transporter [Acidimicrobiales bacterium]
MSELDDAPAGAIGPPRTRLAVVLLVLVTAAWGSTFLLVKDVIGEMPAMRFLALRFVLAALALVVLRPRALFALPLPLLGRGMLLGGFLAGGYVFQTLGLEHTSAAVSGFVTGLAVVFTPLLAWPLLGHRCAPSTLVAVAVATSGLAVLSLRGAQLGVGELLTVLGALCYALQIVGLGAWARAGELYRLTVLQLLTVAVICTAAALPGGLALPSGALSWFGVVATALLATAIAFVVQSWAQSFISPTRAAIIFTLEPAFAGLVAYLGGETFGWPVLVGGVLVVTAMFLAELGPEVEALPGGDARERPAECR